MTTVGVYGRSPNPCTGGTGGTGDGGGDHGFLIDQITKVGIVSEFVGSDFLCQIRLLFEYLW